MGMAQTILESCTREKTDVLIKQFNDHVDQFVQQGFQPWGVAIDGDGTGLRLLGLLPIGYPPRADTKETIKQAVELGVKVQTFTDDPLDITKENGRHLGIGNNIFSCKILTDGLTTESDDQNIDDLIFHADGYADIDGEKKCEIVQRLQNMGHILAVTGNNHHFRSTIKSADIAIAVPKLSDDTFSVADIVLIESSLSGIIKESTQASLLYDGSQPASNKIGSRYSARFIIITGIIGLLCLVAAIALTISGAVGLRNYGFANAPLIAGIVLFGVGGVLTIVACLTAGLK